MTRCRRCFARVNTVANGRGGDCHECGHRLDDGFAEPGTFIVMAGARRTGKSIFIAVLLEQLKQYVSKVKAADDDVETRFEEFYRGPLYVQRGMLKPTPSALQEAAHQREPLHFVITRDDDVRHHLVIRDVAGEDLEYLGSAKAVDPKELSFFRNADAVFFLYDPGTLPTIRDIVADLPAAQETGGDPLPVLERTVELMRDGSDPRLAVIMAKFDIVQERAEADHNDSLAAILRNNGATFRSDASPMAPADDAESEFLHEEIRSLLHRLEARELLGEARRAPGEHRFFAVSALGESPHGERLHARGIVPFRCLDPLRWALAGTGILPAAHPQQLVQRDRFGFTVVEPIEPVEPPRRIPPPQVEEPPQERWQRFSRVCLALAVLAAAAVGIAGFLMFETVDVTAVDPVAQSRTWAYVLLGSAIAASVVAGLAATAAIGARPRTVALLALLCAVGLPVLAGWAAYHWGTDALATNAAADPRLQGALDVLESWHVPVGELRG
jgi:hypothetical protein